MFETRKIKKLLKPRAEFADRTKAAFLAVYDRAYPVSVSHVAQHFGIFVKALVAAGAVAAIFGGMSVYADTANVAADSPLYSLKRLGESVQLAVTPIQNRPQLEATFANRRVNEIADLETRKPSSTLIAHLSGDLDTALDTSLHDAEDAKLGDGKLTSFCDKVLSVIATTTVEVRGNGRRRGGGNGEDNGRGIVGRFINQCGSSVGVTTSTSVTATTTIGASTTLPFPPHWRFLFPSEEDSTSTATSTPILSTTTQHDHEDQGDAPGGGMQIFRRPFGQGGVSSTVSSSTRNRHEDFKINIKLD